MAPPWAALARERFLPANEDSADSLNLLLTRAMIAAAHADGHIDAGEQARIFERIGELELSAEEKALLMDELRQPLSIPQLAAQATSPEIAAEIYAASLLAIDTSAEASYRYLAELAERLALPAPLVDELHRTAGETLEGAGEPAASRHAAIA